MKEYRGIVLHEDRYDGLWQISVNIQFLSTVSLDFLTPLKLGEATDFPLSSAHQKQCTWSGKKAVWLKTPPGDVVVNIRRKVALVFILRFRLSRKRQQQQKYESTQNSLTKLTTCYCIAAMLPRNVHIKAGHLTSFTERRCSSYSSFSCEVAACSLFQVRSGADSWCATDCMKL